jgi:hypothetical protein
LFGPDQAGQVERLLRDLAGESRASRQDFLEVVTDSLAGRKARNARTSKRGPTSRERDRPPMRR